MAVKYDCVACKKQVTATKNNRYRSHTDAQGNPCEMSSEPIPEHALDQPVGGTDDPSVPREGVDYALCPQCDRKVKLTRLGYFEPHDQTLRGGDRCPLGGTRVIHLKKTQDVPLPGDRIPEKGVYQAQVPEVSNQQEAEAALTSAPMAPVAPIPLAEPAVTASGDVSMMARENLARQPMAVSALASVETGVAGAGVSGVSVTESASTDALASMEGSSEWPAPGAGSGASTETNFPESSTTSKTSPKPEPAPSPTGPFSMGPVFGGWILQPFSHILQPTMYEGAKKPEPMNGPAAEIATRFKEIFYSHSNRRTTDNRSAQTTLGPSEIGTPCDRRLAMALMGVEPVNPGGDGWAAWVGTQGHAGLEQMFRWASANTGRFLTEARLKLPSKLVPHGTSDLFDRVHGEVWDFKFMGAYSLKQFKLEGPSESYRIQGHTYGLGQELAGEKVNKVAILGLPRAGSSLDEMHVWSEPYDKKVAVEALRRVDEIAAEVGRLYGRVAVTGEGPASKMEAAQTFPTGDDCRYCPFHLKGDRDMARGCPGK